MSALRDRVVRAAAQRVVPWRNGLGSTREVAIEPPGAAVQGGFRWRVSVAGVAADGPFSTFAGVDRQLWLLRGAGLRLDVGGREAVLDRPWQRVDFAGETPVTAVLLGGPTEDVNVMVERASTTAATAIVALAAGASWRDARGAGQHVRLVLDGDVALPDGTLLHAGDVLLGEGPGEAALRAAPAVAGAVLLAATFTARSGGTR